MSASTDVMPSAELQKDGQFISQRLKDFRVVRNHALRLAINFYPFIIALIILLDLLFFQQRLINLLRLTNYTALALSAFFFVRLCSTVPATLDSLWNRGVIRRPNNDLLDPKEYVNAINILDRWLNSRGGWLLSAVAGAYAIVSYLTLYQINSWPETLFRAFMAGFSWFLAASALWRMLLLAYSVIYLSFQFRLVVLPAHPDQSGGLRPLGDLCLANALVVIAPAISAAGWIFAVTSPTLLSTYPQLASFQYSLQNGFFQASLFVALLAGLTVFFLPLSRIHQSMLQQRLQHAQRLDELGSRIDAISNQLLNSVQSLEPGDVQNRLEGLKWMQEVYKQSKRFPVWPFDVEIVVRLTVSQIVPLLSLTGLAKPISDAIANLFISLQPK